jgi:2-polyprenyl-6-methoxyphenol hydroxylase-like FAD-dependent oxidoreductase
MHSIAIVGSGVSGAASAIFLARAGYRVKVFEAVAEPEPIGAGVLIQPTGQAILQELGLLDLIAKQSSRIDSLYGDTPTGRTVLDVEYKTLSAKLYGLGVQRGVLMQALWGLMRGRYASQIEWRCGVAVDRFTQTDTQVELFKTDAASPELSLGRFDALVIANGSFSNLRTQIKVRQSEQIFPWGAWWTLLPKPEGMSEHMLRQRFRSGQEMLGLMPVGNGLLNFFWSVPREKLTHLSTLDLALLKQKVCALYPEAAPVMAHLTDGSVLRPARYNDVWMKQWHDGRVLAIGDCAHAMSPQLGQGANMALIDAWELSKQLTNEQNIPKAFAHFSQVRKGHIRFYQRVSIGLNPIFQSHGRLIPALRDAFFALFNRLPFVNTQAVKVLSGMKAGWLWGMWSK